MTTDEERFLVVDGRRWRRTDPSIPEKFRTELVGELMSARRAIGQAKKPTAADRARVQDAKVALGERGDPWWEEPTEAGRRERIAATIRALLRHRDGTSICPSDVARAIGGRSWRGLMDEVREVATGLADTGEIEVRQKGEVVDPRSARGPLRYHLGGS